MKRLTVGISFLLASLFLFSCSKYRPFVESDARNAQATDDWATIEAIYGTLPPTEPFDFLEGYCGLINCETGTPAPESTGTPTPVVVGTIEPAYQRVLVNGNGSEWVSYSFSKSLTPGVELSVLRDGSTWEVIEVTDNAIRVQLKGWTPENDLDLQGELVRVKSCIGLEHAWDHDRGKKACHTSIWGEGLTATVPSGTEGTLAGVSTTSRSYRDTRTGEWTYGPGWEVVFEQKIWIPIENGYLQ